MAREHIDKQLKDDLEKGTEDALRYKEEIWTAIKGRIEEERMDGQANSKESAVPGSEEPTFRARGTRRGRGRSRAGKRAGLLLLTTAVAASIWVGLNFQSAPVQAWFDQVKAWFAPQKEVQQEIEGMPESSENLLYEGANSDYVIYIDESWFQMIHGDEIDRIEPKEKPEDDRYPEVYMEISQRNEAPQAVAEQLQAELKDYPKLEAQSIEEPVRGWEVRAIGGSGGQEWDDPVIRYYVFDNEQGGSFIVKQHYFLEASEGYGARFYHMMKEFYITGSAPPQ